MGPSGSGKTTLLNALSNRNAVGGGQNIHVSGYVKVDGQIVPPSFFYSKSVSFVPQDTCLFSELTPRESIRFATACLLPSLTQKQIEKRVNQTITELNLQKCADTQIGNEMFRGVSGGERKRVSIGVSIVAQPSILFLDEPTTGLDTETASMVIRSIQGLSLKAPGGFLAAHQENKELTENSNPHAIDVSSKPNDRIVIMTLHQPSSEIWHMIDHLVLLVAGHIVYNGPAKTAMDYFVAIGFRRPLHTNPADYFLDILQGTEEDDDDPIPEADRTLTAAIEHRPGASPASVVSSATSAASAQNSVVSSVQSALSAVTSSQTTTNTVLPGGYTNAAAANKRIRVKFLATRWKQYERAQKLTGGQLSGRAKRAQIRQLMEQYKDKRSLTTHRKLNPNRPAPTWDDDDDDLNEPESEYDPDDSELDPIERRRSMADASHPDWQAIAQMEEENPLPYWTRTIHELKLLSRRSWTTFKRTKLMVPMKIAQICLTAILIICLFAPLDKNQVSVLDRSGAMYLNIIVQMFATVLSIVMTFPEERGVFLHEQASRMYSVTNYFVSKLLIDVPILFITIFLFSLFVYFPLAFQASGFGGFFLVLFLVAMCGHGIGLIVASCVASPPIAALLAPLCIAPFILFSHIALPGDPNATIVPILRPFQWLSPFWWGLDALMVLEFRGLRLSCDNDEIYEVPSPSGSQWLCRFIKGEEVLDFYGISYNAFGPSVGQLFVLAFLFVATAGALLKVLSMRVASSVPMSPPPKALLAAEARARMALEHQQQQQLQHQQQPQLQHQHAPQRELEDRSGPADERHAPGRRHRERRERV